MCSSKIQFVLADTFVPARNIVSRWCQDFYVYGADVRRNLMTILESKQGQDLNLEEEVTKRIVTEIVKEGDHADGLGWFALDIHFLIPGNAQMIDVSLEPYLPDKESILTMLSRKFQDKVKLSLYLKWEEWNFEFSAIKGMPIKPRSGVCTGSGKANYPQLLFPHRCPKLQLQIVAEIGITISIGASFSQRLLEKETFSDVTIIAENGAEIKAHKAFIAVCSPVLEKMLQSGMEESQTGRIDMSDVSENGVKAFLHYIYHGDLMKPDDNFEVAFELLYLSHKYDVSRLESEIGRLLLEAPDADFDVAVAFKMYMFTRNIEGAAELKMKAIQVLQLKRDELELLQEYNDLFEIRSNSKLREEFLRDLDIV